MCKFSFIELNEPHYNVICGLDVCYVNIEGIIIPIASLSSGFSWRPFVTVQGKYNILRKIHIVNYRMAIVLCMCMYIAYVHLLYVAWVVFLFK